MLWELIYYAKISLKVTFSAISIIQRTFTKSCLSVQVFLWPCVALRTRWHLATKAACIFLPIGSIYKRWISCMLKYKNIRRTWPFSPVLACKSMNKANLVWVEKELKRRRRNTPLLSSLGRPSAELVLSFILQIQLEIWGCFCIYLLYWMNFSCGHRPIRWQICPVMGKLVCINSWNKVKSKTNSTYKKSKNQTSERLFSG